MMKINMLDFIYINGFREQCTVTLNDPQAIRCLSNGTPIVIYPDLNESMPKGNGANITGLSVTSFPMPEDQLDTNENCASDENEKEDTRVVWAAHEGFSPEQTDLIALIADYAFELGVRQGKKG